jgi:uncharacterized OsmC-like protein
VPAIEVLHAKGDEFLVGIREHALVVDQPVDGGGGDAGPTPTELFVAGLASCVAFYAERFLRRHDLALEGLRVTCRYEMSEGRPARVASIEVAVTAPSVPPERRDAFAAVIEHCTVHNTLQRPPEVRIEVAERAAAA